MRLARDAAAPGVLRSSFIPATDGLYTFAFAGGTPRTAFRATVAAPAPADAWARLSLLAYRSGGRVLAADSLRPVIARLGDGSPARRGPSAALFGVLVMLGAAEWAIRRLRGRK